MALVLSPEPFLCNYVYSAHIYPILRDNTLCFIWCLSGTVRHDNYYG